MSNEGLYIMAGLAKGFEKGVDNYYQNQNKSKLNSSKKTKRWKLKQKG